MKTTVVIAAIAAIGIVAAPGDASAQMRSYDQGMQRMRSKLPTAVFDGTTLNITTYVELKKVENYLRNYSANLSKAMKAWKAMTAGRNSSRLKALQANQNYFKVLLATYRAKKKIIKAPVKAKPKEIRVIKASEIFVGPDVTSDKPVLIDTIGPRETLFRAWGSPGSSKRPSRWSAKLHFYVKYGSLASDDVVMIQVKKGRRKLGKPTPCRAKSIMSDVGLAYFECQSPVGRDAKKMFKTAGLHSIELSYKKLIEGKVFKKFAVLQVTVLKLKHGSSNTPSVAWGESHDAKLRVTTIEEKLGQSNRGGLADAKRSIKVALRQDGGPSLYLRTWFKYKKRVPRTKITCLHKGKRVSEGRNVPGKSYNTWSYVRKGSSKRDDSTWQQATYDLMMLKPRPYQGKRGGYRTEPHWMSDHPGKYRCVITGDGKILKEVFFTADAEGEIVKPPCQLKSLNTLRTVTIVRATSQGISDRTWNKKAGRKRGYEGRVKWAKGCPL